MSEKWNMCKFGMMSHCLMNSKIEVQRLEWSPMDLLTLLWELWTLTKLRVLTLAERRGRPHYGQAVQANEETQNGLSSVLVLR